MSETDRERVIAHLADCADCREVFAATVQIAEDLDAEDHPAAVAVMPVRRETRAPRIVRSLAAAATVVVVGAVVTWRLNTAPAPPSPSEWLAAMPPANELAPHVWGGIRMRGGGEMSASVPQATELGALLVDAEVTLRAGDAAPAAEALQRMAAILAELGLMESDVATLLSIANQGDVELMRAAYAKALPELTQHLRERFQPAILDLGTFAEEAQVAASAGRGDFLASRAARRYLDWLTSRPEMALPMESRPEPMPLPENVQAALRTLRREGASAADQADAAQEILDTLSR